MAKKNQLTTSDYFKYEEFERFMNCLHKDKNFKWEMYSRLSFCTGCRISDVLKLRWVDVLNKAAINVVEQKTGKPRIIPFNPSVQRKFNELYILCDRPDVKDYILQSPRGDRPVTVQYVNQKLKDFKYKYKLDICHFSSHTFRKTFGRYIYDTHNHSEESIILLNKIFSHSTLQVTRIYIGITQDEIDGIFDSIQF